MSTTIVKKPNSAHVDLTDEQLRVLDQIQGWFGHQSQQTPEFRLAGKAGTGKTTLIREIAAYYLREKRIRFASLTGKAAHVMRRKGIPAKTIHSTIYEPIHTPTGIDFVLADPNNLKADLIIIDEASMVNRQIYEDLLSFGIPVLWVGDNAQLEPIGKDPHVMKRPDAELQEVHRQAWASPIIRLGYRMIDKGRVGPEREEVEDAGAVYVTRRNTDLADESLLTCDQVICGFNRTRVETNNLIRACLECEGLVVPGDKLICLKNNRDYGIYNGMMAHVVSVGERYRGNIELELEDYLGHRFTVPACERQFGQERTLEEAQNPRLISPRESGPRTYWDYGYAISCHKSQGSEFDSVMVLEEVARNWNKKRWAYTAITRAAQSLVYVK